MAAQKCFRCGVIVHLDGTSTCECVLMAAEEVDAAFEAFRPRLKTSSSHTEVGVTEPDTAGSDRSRAGRRRGVIVVTATAVIGTLALTIGTVSSGQDGGGNAEIPELGPTGPAVTAPESEEGPTPSPSAPQTGPSSKSATNSASHGEGDMKGRSRGSSKPPRSETSSATAGNVAGGTAAGGGSPDGGPTSDTSGGGDGTSGPGGEDNGGPSHGGGEDDHSGGLLSGGLLGGSDHDGNNRAKHKKHKRNESVRKHKESRERRQL
jgi:hypothetical protein